MDERHVYIASKYSLVYRPYQPALSRNILRNCAVVLTCAEVDSNQLTRLFVLRLQLQQGLLRVVARVLGQNLQRKIQNE